MTWTESELVELSTLEVDPAALVEDLNRLTKRPGADQGATYACKELQKLALAAANVEGIPVGNHYWLVTEFINTIADLAPTRDVLAARDLFAMFADDPLELIKFLEKHVKNVTEKTLKNIGAREWIAGRHYLIDDRGMRLRKGDTIEDCAKQFLAFTTDKTHEAVRSHWAEMVHDKLHQGRSRVDDDSPSETPDEPTGIGHALAESAQIRKSLKPLRVKNEIKRDLIEDKIVPRLIGQSIPVALAIKGDAGAGKTVIAGQVYDALRNRTYPLLVTCENLPDRLTTGDDFDAAFGHLVKFPQGLIAAVRQIDQKPLNPRESRKPVVIIFDTVDAVLNDRTINGVIDLFRRLISTNASIIFTCRRYDYHVWFQTNRGQANPLVSASIEPVNVPDLTESEVRQLVSSYLEAQSASPPGGASQFIERIQSLAKERGPVRSIISNPYFLVMLCETFADVGDIPPDLTATRLGNAYYGRKIAESRDFGRQHEVSRARRVLWLKVAGELWRRSKETIVLDIPESWIDKVAEDPMAFDDLLSEEVLVQRPQAGPVIQFTHQFLAEYSMAIYLRDEDHAGLISLLDELKANATSRWFTWPIVRYVLALADSSFIKTLLGRLDLSEAYAYRAAALGLVEREDAGHLQGLAKYPNHYGALLESLYLVPDARLDEAFEILALIMRNGKNTEVSKAAVITGKLAARFSVDAGRHLPKLVSILDAIEDIRNGKAVAKSRDPVFPDELFKHVVGEPAERGITLPDNVLARILKYLSHATPDGYRAAIRAFLVEGTSVSRQRRLFEKLLSFRDANKVRPLAVDLARAAVTWDVSADLENPAEWSNLHPVVFLKAGGKKARQLRPAVLAGVSMTDASLRKLLVNTFLHPGDGETGERALIFLQEVVQAGGQDWLAEHLRTEVGMHDDAGIGRICGFLKSLTKSKAEVRHEWANWLKPLVNERLYGTVDTYLRLGWDHAGHLETAISKLELVPLEERQRVILNLGREGTPGMAAVIARILDEVEFDDTSFLRVRLMNIHGDEIPEGLVDAVASPSEKTAKQAIKLLEDAAKHQRPWHDPTLLDKYASFSSEKIRVGLLRTLVLLMSDQVGDRDHVVKLWVGNAVARDLGRHANAYEELSQLLRLSYEYLHDETFLPSEHSFKEIECLITQVISTIEQHAEVLRDLVALVKKIARNSHKEFARKTVLWLYKILSETDISTIRDGHPFVKEALGKLIEKRVLLFEDITSEAYAWPVPSLKVIADLINDFHPQKKDSPLLDQLLQAEHGDGVRALIASYRLPKTGY